MSSVCGCHGPISHIHIYFNQDKKHGDSSVDAVCICVDQQATYTDTSTGISSIEIALCLQSVAIVDRQATFTDTFTKISSMEVTLCLQSVAVVDRKATFTDTSTFTGTSTRISSMVMAL